MARAYEGADALRMSGPPPLAAEPESLLAVGTIPGVAVLYAAGRNGPGVGRLRSQGDGTFLSWRAPGSQSFGTPAQCDSDGAYLLPDGEDLCKWLRVQVYVDHLPAGPFESRVYLADRYGDGAGVGYDDVMAGEAAGGDTVSYCLTFWNMSLYALTRIRVWLASPWSAGYAGLSGGRDERFIPRCSTAIVPVGDGARMLISRSWSARRRVASSLLRPGNTDPERFRLEISLDNVNFYRPDSEYHPDVLVVDRLVGGWRFYVYVRRTIAAGTAFDPAILNLLHVAWDAL